jgi:hypothetical protein
MDFADPLTLALSLATLLLVAILGGLPAIIRVIRMRRTERLLGWTYWPVLHALDERSRRLNEPPQDG